MYKCQIISGMKNVHRLCYYAKAIILFVSLVWLILVLRYFQIRPQFRYRGSLVLERAIPKSQALIYMKRISELVKVRDHYTNINVSSRFKYFDLFMISATRSLPMCESSKAPIFILSANFKQVSDSYFTFYKEMERYQTQCYPPVYALKRRDHLLMNSDLLMNQYVEEINQILNFFNTYQRHHLSVLTFEEGSILLLKALTKCQLTTISQMNKIVFINMFNPNMKILYESPYKYIQQLQQQLIHDQARLAALNNIRIVEISTTKQRNPEQYTIEDENKFSLLFEGRALSNYIKLSSRYMKNIYCFLHEKDYFLYTEFSTALAKFFILDHDRPYSMKEIEYFFYYGDQLYGSITNIFFDRNIKECLTITLNYNHYQELADACIRLSVDPLQNLQHSYKAILIYTEGKINIYNDNFQHLDHFDKSTNQTFYLIQRLSGTSQFYILNDEFASITIKLIDVYHPQLNPFLRESQTDFIKMLEMSRDQYSIIPTCPNQNKLLYPLHINRRGIFHETAFIVDDQNAQCYLDVNQIDIVDQSFLVNWDIERNIVLFTLICSHIHKKKTFERFYLQFIINICLSFLTTSSWLFYINFLLLAFVIIIEKLIHLSLFLSFYLHEHLEVKYQKIMLYSTLVVSLAKNLFQKYLDMDQISPWKIFVLSIIFLINPTNIIILVCKMYFLAENIAFNHNDVVEIVCILGWIYYSICDGESENGFSEKKEEVRWPEWLLVCIFGTLIEGPTIYMNYSLNAYIVIKLLMKRINQS